MRVRRARRAKMLDGRERPIGKMSNGKERLRVIVHAISDRSAV
jgi:hypothetical protein